MSGVVLRDPLLGAEKLRGGKGCWDYCWWLGVRGVARVLLGSRCSEGPEACFCGAEKNF